MKIRILFTVLTIGMFLSTYAQKPTITLTFTADNNGQHVPLNSIMIENLSQGGDTTLYAPDTVLVLDYLTGLEEDGDFIGDGFLLSQNYPNPMKGKTTIDLHLPERANILITISDVFNREVVNQKFQLDHGSHTFTFYPGRESMYFLTVLLDKQSRTIKMINSPGFFSVLSYCTLGYNGSKDGTGEHKAGTMMNYFVFNLGDLLQYTASSAWGERTIIDTLSGNHNYIFQFSSGGMPCPGMLTVTDIEGNVYNTMLIANQCWMKENLKTTTYRNGMSIPNVTDANAWSNLSTGAYIWYDNDISWKDKYGALYNWYATVDPNGLCPAGWHVPTNDEWIELTDYIGGTGTPHGNELKSCRQVNSLIGGCSTSTHPRWNANSLLYGTDEYGFSGLPGSFRFHNGGFDDIGVEGYWWSSSGAPSSHAWYRGLGCYVGFVYLGSRDRHYGLSVRCIRDN